MHCNTAATVTYVIFSTVINLLTFNLYPIEQGKICCVKRKGSKSSYLKFPLNNFSNGLLLIKLNKALILKVLQNQGSRVNDLGSSF